MANIRVGVVGAGQIAQTAHLPLLSKMSEFDLTGLCDVHRPTAKTVAARFGIGTVEYDYQAFVTRPDIDAIVIATPTDTHFAIGSAALDAGKHVLIEKPLTREANEAERLAAQSRKTGCILMVGMNHRFRQDVQALKSLIAHGELGHIYMVQAGWLNYQSSTQSWVRRRERSGGGVFMDLGIVMIDLILWMLDFPTASTVSAMMYRHRTNAVEDSASCFIRLSQETSVALHVSWNASTEKQQYYLDLIGSKGTASINPLRIHKVIAGTPSNITPVLHDSGSGMFRKSYEHELRHFAGAINGLYPAVSTGDEAVFRMHLVEAAYASASAQKEQVVR